MKNTNFGSIIKSKLIEDKLFSNSIFAGEEGSAPAGEPIEYVVLAGGGAGGSYSRSAGGGAGGVLVGTETIQLGTAYDLIVGAGGAHVSSGRGSSGSNSTFSSHVAIGGGGGSTYNTAGLNGGSGGGSYTSAVGLGTAGQGNDGGNRTDGGNAGGGGGVNSVGGQGTGTNGGAGGTGNIYYQSIYNTGQIGGGGGGSSDGTGGSGTFGGGRGGDLSVSPSNGLNLKGGGGGGARLGEATTNGGGGRIWLCFSDTLSYTISPGVSYLVSGPLNGFVRLLINLSGPGDTITWS